MAFLGVACSSPKSPRIESKEGLDTALKAHPILDSALLQFKRGNYLLAQRNYEKGLSQLSDQDSALQFFVLNQLGVVHYQMAQVDDAIKYWDLVNTHFNYFMEPDQKASILTNLGSAYMGKGFFQTSISFFLEAKRAFELDTVRSENFWINHLNIGVAYMESRNLFLANRFFNEIPLGLSENLDVLIHINLAKLKALQGNEKEFQRLMNLSADDLTKASFYQSVFNEVSLEFNLEFGNVSELSEVFDLCILDKGKRGVFFDLLLINTAAKIGQGSPYPETYWNTVLPEIEMDDNVTWLMYYKSLAEFKRGKGDFESAFTALKKVAVHQKLLDESREETDLLDYGLLAQRKEIEQQLKGKIKENELQANRLKAQIYFILVLVLLLLLLVIGGIFIYYQYRTKNKLAQEDLEKKNLQLNLSEQRQLDLEKDLIFKNQKLQSILLTVSKIAILKKQIESYFQLIDSESLDEKAQRLKLKQLKFDFTLFFNNYQDLAVLANLEGAAAKKMEELKKSHALLSENELRVLLLISQNYTSKEMALLLTCTEKNIEYYRSQIRKKLEIPKEETIMSFINHHI